MADKPSRTRAGTQAQPFPWEEAFEEQLERTKKRAKGFAEDPVNELRNITRQYLYDPTATPEENERKMDDFVMGMIGSTGSPKAALKKASEVFGKHEGKYLMITEADRTKIGDGFLGGPGFSGLQRELPAYKEARAAWGVAAPGKAVTIANANARVPEGQAIWAPMLGSPTQHKSNQMVFDQILNKFRRAARAGQLEPDLHKTINYALANIFDKKTGNPLFPPDVDIMAKNFRSLANTFDRRAAAADIMGGVGVGGKKGTIIDYPEIIRSTTDPLVIDSPVGAIGPRAFTLTGEIGEHPELNPAFPYILRGEDLGELYTPVPRDLAMLDVVGERAAAGKKPTVWAFTRGHGPMQFMSEEWLTNLQKHGYAKGGLAMAGGGVPEKRDVSQLFPINPELRGETRTRAGVPVQDTNVLSGALQGLGETLLGAGRGATAMGLGAPADILNMLDLPKLMTGESYQIPYGLEYFKEKLPLAPQTQTGQVAQQMGEFLPISPEQPIKAAVSGAKKVGKALAPTAADMMQMQLERATAPMRSYVIKPEGGNWVRGAAEKFLRDLRYDESMIDPVGIMSPADKAEETARVTSMNNFVDKKLSRYVQNQMGTPSDPLRLQADAWVDTQKSLLADKQRQIDKVRADIQKAQQVRGVDPEVLTRSQARLRELEKERDFIKNRRGLHFEPMHTGAVQSGAASRRAELGMPRERNAKSDAGKKWEDMSDLIVKQSSYMKQPQIDVAKAYSEIKEAASGDTMADKVILDSVNRELEKMGGKYALENPDALAYRTVGNTSHVGFDHMMDEIDNALRPSQGLPDYLQLTPKELDKMSVAQVSEHVDKINAWRASQKAEVDKARAANAATVEHKTYDVVPGTDIPNDQGLRWVEIQTPKELPEKFAMTQSDSGKFYAVDKETQSPLLLGRGQTLQQFNTPEEVVAAYYKNHPEVIEDALKYEGEILSHCVGGYCPDVIEGRSRIFSLRDAEGRPHATIETKPNDVARAVGNLPDEERWALKEEVINKYFGGVQPGRSSEDKYFNLIDKAYVEKYGYPPESIKQIKGLQNRKPDDQYMPFIQDFVKSGQWSDVQDLHHTDLRKIDPDSALAKKMKAAGIEPPPYVSDNELSQLLKEYKQGLYSWNQGGAVSGEAINLDDVIGRALQQRHMADGGAVNLDDVIGQALRSRGMAEGGAAYNTNPDMSDGGQLIQGQAF